MSLLYGGIVMEKYLVFKALLECMRYDITLSCERLHGLNLELAKIRRALNV
jgi:hypothetical protein